MWLCTHGATSSKNNVKICNSASYKPPKYIYPVIGYTLGLLEPGLSDETVEIVSDLFLFSHSSPILLSFPKDHYIVSVILYSLLYKYVTSSLILKAFSFSFKTNISTSSCPVIVGGVVIPVECSLVRWNRALYFQIVSETSDLMTVLVPNV